MKSAAAESAAVSESSDIYSMACPSRRALELVAGKWALLIFPALDAGPMRNSALLRKIEGISQKMLTQTLKELERNGLVLRRDLQTVPPHVEYQLSPLGLSLSKTLVALDQWTQLHHADLELARQRFDQPEKVVGSIVHRLN